VCIDAEVAKRKTSNQSSGGSLGAYSSVDVGIDIPIFGEHYVDEHRKNSALYDGK